MAILTANQIAGLVKAAGWSGETGVIAVAVALQESSGNTSIRNACCTGLFQIHKVHAGINGTSKNEAEFRNQLENPVTNVTIAKTIYDKEGWDPWEAYTSGAYRKHMTAARAGWSKPTVEGIDVVHKDLTDPSNALELAQVTLPDPLARVAGAIETVIEVINRTGAWIADRDNWIRIAQVVAGLGLGYVGFQVVVQPYVQPYITGATKTAKKYYTKGMA